MSDNIKVAIKVRPLIKREEGESIQWVVQENTIAQIDPETGKRAEMEYQFDNIFGMGQKNVDVFKETVEPIVEAAMKGFNGTIFAYGQTSSGKTYTMMGSKEEPGVIPLAVDSIFKYIENDPTRVYLLRVSYLEIYNEKINDLLNIESKDLKIKEDINGIVNVVCKEVMTHSPKDVLQAMRRGDKERRVGETNMNDRSSRSHTIFRITIESCVKKDIDDDKDNEATNVSQLNLIDLAGSERARQTGATGERFNEGRHINLSLMTLSLVIKQLSESNNQYINFRDSKLTRILQASLGGNALTTIICAVTPAALEETQCTLAFAQRAKGIKNKPQVNEVVSKDVLLRRVLKQVAKLNAQVGDLSCQLQEKEKEILKGRIEMLNGKMLSGSPKDILNAQNRDRRRRTWGGNSANITSPSATKFGYLPTIDECEKPKITEADDEKNYVKRRQSVIHQVDLADLSFKTEFADFELQLINDEKERMARHSSGSTDGFFSDNLITRRVQFRDEDEFQECKDYSPEITPEKKRTSASSLSPGTPKSSLREEIKDLRNEVIALREYTTLERQLFQDDCVAAENYAQHEKKLAFMKQSLEDSNQVCKDLNKKYSELQSEFSILNSKHEASVRECENLTQQVTSLESFRERFAMMEAERNEFKSKWIETDNKLKALEGEFSSHDYEIELMKGKHKSREKELEASLNSAWKDLQNFTGLDKEEIKNLGGKTEELNKMVSTVNELNTQISSLEDQLLSSSTISEENTLLNSKIQELNEELEKHKEDNILLNKRVEELLENQNNIDELSRRVVDLDSILIGKEELINKNMEISKLAEEDFIRKINNLESIISEKEMEMNKNMEFSKSTEDDLLRKISNLESIISEKEMEVNKNMEFAKSTEEDLLKKINNLESIISEKEMEVNKNMEFAKSAEEDLLKKINNLESIISENRIHAENSSKSITELQNIISEKEMKINENMEVSKSAEEDLLKKISNLESIISEKEMEMNKNIELSKSAEEDLLMKISNLETIISENLVNAENSSKSVTELQNIISEKEMEISKNMELSKSAEEDLLKKISNLESILSENRVNAENSSKSVTELEIIISEKEMEISKIMELSKSAEEDFLKKISNLESIISENRIHAENSSKSLTELQNIISEKEMKINENMELFKSTEEDLLRKISNLESIISENRVNAENSSKSITELEAIISEKEMEINKNMELMKLAEDEVAKKLSDHSDIIVEKDQFINSLKLEIEGMQLKLKEKCDELSEMKSRFEDFSSLSEQEKNESISKAREELESLQKSLEIKENELSAALMQLETKESEIANYDKIISEMKSKMIDLESFEIQGKELLALEENVKLLNSEIVEKNMSVIELEKLIEDKNLELCKTVENFDGQISQLKIENENLKSELEEKLNIIKEKNENLSVLESDLKNLSAERDGDKNMVIKCKEEIKDHEKSLEIFMSECSSLKIENEESKTRFKRLSEINETAVINKPIEFLKSTNGSHSESMDISIGPEDSVFSNQTLDENKSISLITTSIMENSVNNISTFTEVVLNNDISKLKNKTPQELQIIVQELINVKKTLEETLRLKIQEAEELQNDFRGFTAGMESLKETILLLTTENSELTTKANQDKKNIDEVKLQFEEEIKKLMEEKIQSNVDEEKRQSLIEDYKNKMEILSKENIELSTNLMEKVEEFDAIKEKLNIATARIKQLENENIELSDNLMNKIEEYDGIIEKMRSETQENSKEEIEDDSSVVQLLQNQISELKALNAKLSEAKLTSCVQCVELVEKNEVRMSLKNEVKILNKKLRDLQEKFDEETANVEVLRSKFNEDLNTSVLNETLVNASFLEGVDVSYVEEKIHALQNELDSVKENHGKLEIRYQEKCCEIEELRVSSSLLDSSSDNFLNKREANISRIQGDLEKEKSDINYLKKKINSVSTTLNKLKSDQQNNETAIDSLKSENQVAEVKISKAYDQIKELEIKLEKTVDEKREFGEKNSTMEMEINGLKQLLNGHKENNEVLMGELEKIKATPPPEREKIISLNHLIEEYKLNVEKLETEVQELKNKLGIYSTENLKLREQVKNLEATDNQMEICENYESTPNKNSKNEIKKITEELETARESIKKEIASMNRTSEMDDKDFENKTVTELFKNFITVIMSKEQEIMKLMARNFEKEKMKLEEKVRQSEDAEKRLNIWAKELEADVERLQSDLTNEEIKSSKNLENIAKLENRLKECEYEKQVMKEKMDVMETDFNILQTDYEKYSKEDMTNKVQNVEKQIAIAIQNSQDEHQVKLSKIENSYKLKIEDLSGSVESLKTKNIELKSNLDCLEISEKQLKSIVDLKNNELAKSTSNVERLEKELENISEAFNQIKKQNSDMSEKLEEITILLKQRCDKMSEYKTQLETIKPEYEILREQTEERDRRLEKYKTEAESLREANTAQMISLRDFTDQLEIEKLKSAGLNKQLADITNRNSIVQSELDKLMEKCEELSAENSRLVRKIRNSTDRETARLQLADLTDQNQILQQDLERSENRITELQNAKSELLKTINDLQGKYDSLNREQSDLKNTLSLYKNKIDERRLDISINEKFDNLVQEKNKIADELEVKKSECQQLEGKLAKLEEQNKDLDEEMDDIVKKIEDLQNENEELGLKLFDLEAERSTWISKNGNKEILDHDNLEKRLKVVQRDFEISCKTSELLKKENEELRLKLYKNNEEPKSTSSSRSESPAPLSSRKQRRSDLFNQNRPKELTEELVITEVTETPICQCESRLRKVQELEHQLALSLAKYRCLQIKIENDNQPYKKKCEEYEEIILSYKRRNDELKAKINIISERKAENSECRKCKDRRNNQRDQYVQCIPIKSPIIMTGEASGIIEDHAKFIKLESDKNQLKQLCLSRLSQVKELRQQKEILEKEIDRLRDKHCLSCNSFSKNTLSATKENVSSNILGELKLTTPHRFWPKE